jgi:calcium-dependent protein kinase
VISYCHSINIVQGNIRAENVLIEQAVTKKGSELIIKLADWGTSYPIKDGQKIEYQQDVSYYISPENIKTGLYDKKCDLWSVGVLFYIMLSSKPPFHGEDEDMIK